MLAIVGASGKLANATLLSILERDLIPAASLVCTTSQDSSHVTWQNLAKHRVHVRHASFESPASFEVALAGCTRMFLVSSPRIQLDFHDAPSGSGRERDHIVAIEAARRVGVRHIYYTSLAFASPSKANVMMAHTRTEEYLSTLTDVTYTVIREGLYNESWPLYFGHFDVKNDVRDEVVVAGDSPISWTSIKDLGLANALVLSRPLERYKGRTMYLSNTFTAASPLEKVAGILSSVRGRIIKLKVVPRPAHEAFYITDCGMEEGFVRWWATTYDALRDGECLIQDKTMQELLESVGVRPTPLEDTIREMIGTT